MAVLALIIALIAAAAAIGSWITAIRANKTSKKVAGIEQARRHEELRPVFSFNAKAVTEQSALLNVSLAAGPSVVDEVVIKVVDEKGREHWGAGPPDGVTKEQADLFIWGPWQFATEASEQIADRRTTKARRYSRSDGKNWDKLELRRTTAGPWMSMSDDAWQRDVAGALRLQVTSRCTGHEAWIEIYEVTVEPRTRSGDGGQGGRG